MPPSRSGYVERSLDPAVAHMGAKAIYVLTCARRQLRR